MYLTRKYRLNEFGKPFVRDKIELIPLLLVELHLRRHPEHDHLVRGGDHHDHLLCNAHLGHALYRCCVCVYGLCKSVGFCSGVCGLLRSKKA